MIANPQRRPVSKEEPGGWCAWTRTAEKTADGREEEGSDGLTRSSAGGRNCERRRNPGGECSNNFAEISAAQEA
ncbi:hypothetical protein NDU88_000284 [Pleurodeles waltl]|uniref:RNase H type-1 domain-containing protein n=1 Tax=Pleurodeles waltl TaxID=8319 RepID=A0AAV7V4N8_PLEWA|nr:hypothetical protein NDU88_000284 [Pleurodeles waltl]